MLTPKGVTALLSRIFETGGMTEAMEADMQKLKFELDEREGILRKYGEDYPQDADEYEWKAKVGDTTEWEGKYRDLVSRYNAKFFSGGDTHGDDTVIRDNVENAPAENLDTEDDIKDEDITIEELLKEEEE